MKTSIKHLSHYMVLFGILVASFIGLVTFSYDKNFQTAIVIAMGLSYIAWGIVHHYLNKDLHFEVVLEYTAVTILGLVILFSLILR